MSVEKQVLVLYALTNRFFTDVLIERVRKVESDMLVYFDERHHDIIDELRETGTVSSELEEKIKTAMNEFKKSPAISQDLIPKE